MRLFRLFLILLISFALPFTNVAAAAMVHCAPPSASAQASASEHADHSGMHADQDHHAMQQQAAADHQQHDTSGQGEIACSHCSYCQSCAAALAPSVQNQIVRMVAASIEKFFVTDLVPQSLVEQPFRPPRSAFA